MALWTNLLKQSANIGDTGSPWVGNGDFTIATADPVIPSQTAHKHTNNGGGTSKSRGQTVGTLTDSPETFAVLVENVSAVNTAWTIFNATAGQHVAQINHVWSIPGHSAIITSPAGSAVSHAATDVGTGESGGDLYLLTVTATPNDLGDSRQVFVYPTGVDTNTNAAIIHWAGLFEASTFSPAYLVNGSTVEERRVVDLDAHKVRVRPRQRSEPLTHRRPRASGKMSTVLHSDAVRARTWSLETEIEDRATGEALQADLDAPGTVHVVHNPIIHPVTGVSVECEAENVQRLDGPLEDNVRVGFDLREVRPL